MTFPQQPSNFQVSSVAQYMYSHLEGNDVLKNGTHCRAIHWQATVHLHWMTEIWNSVCSSHCHLNYSFTLISSSPTISSSPWLIIFIFETNYETMILRIAWRRKVAVHQKYPFQLDHLYLYKNTVRCIGTSWEGSHWLDHLCIPFERKGMDLHMCICVAVCTL